MLRRAVSFVLLCAVGIGAGVGVAALERGGAISSWTAFGVLLAGLVCAAGFALYSVRGLTAMDLWAWDDPDDDA